LRRHSSRRSRDENQHVARFARRFRIANPPIAKPPIANNIKLDGSGVGKAVCDDGSLLEEEFDSDDALAAVALMNAASSSSCSARATAFAFAAALSSELDGNRPGATRFKTAGPYDTAARADPAQRIITASQIAKRRRRPRRLFRTAFSAALASAEPAPGCDGKKSDMVIGRMSRTGFAPCMANLPWHLVNKNRHLRLSLHEPAVGPSPRRSLL
jgi:hypothetical protein